MLRLILPLLITLSALGCEEAPVERVLRDDLNLTIYSGLFNDGLSKRISFEIPEGVDSFFVEVHGDRGKYYLTEFVTPAGRNLIADATFASRGASVMPGSSNWLYPNDPRQRVDPGTYTIRMRGINAYTKGDLNENVDVYVYVALKKPEATCGLRLDFLVDSAALDLQSFDDAVAAIVNQVNINYRQVGIKIEKYRSYRVDMNSVEINPDDSKTILLVDDVLRKARGVGAARDDALQIILVRRIGESGSVVFDPAGFSMGLPGPYSSSLGTSAVLVSTEKYASTLSGTLDADGLASSLSHEIGHYLGLYHTSELDDGAHDPLADTDECSSKSSCSADFRKNIMTSGKWVNDPSSRTVFTDGQGSVMRGHPLCEPMFVEPSGNGIQECTMTCQPPTTCAVLNDTMGCKPACDPDAPTPCAVGTCSIDQLGTYICQ